MILYAYFAVQSEAKMIFLKQWPLVVLVSLITKQTNEQTKTKQKTTITLAACVSSEE